MDMLSFSWLPAFLSGLWAYFKGVTVSDGVSLYGVLCVYINDLLDQRIDFD